MKSRNARNYIHGMRHTKVYKTWCHVKSRCYCVTDHKYSIYGGRGIRMYSIWKNSFQEFYTYIGDPPSPKHSIDRIDNNGDYIPGNIRWATVEEQARNKRSNLYVVLWGTKYCLKQACAIVQLDYKHVWYIHKRDKVDPETAFATALIECKGGIEN
jgi:hypothetical protein